MLDYNSESSMNRCIILLLIGLVAIVTGCGDGRVKSIDDIPPGISWASILAKASDFKTLAEPVNPSATARMFSSFSVH